tara:strand:+ start:73 stop:348 length:276 start_codon:yes stop_codon:yes gene_type:complete
MNKEEIITNILTATPEKYQLAQEEEKKLRDNVTERVKIFNDFLAGISPNNLKDNMVAIYSKRQDVTIAKHLLNNHIDKNQMLYDMYWESSL